MGVFPNYFFVRFSYFVTFVDDYSWVTWVYLLINKSDVCTTFKSFYNMIHTQFGIKLCILDPMMGKSLSNSLFSFFDAFGIVHQTTCPGTHEQNEIVECKITLT